MDYTITLTDTQVKALEWVATDPKNWIQNAANARAQEIGRASCRERV